MLFREMNSKILYIVEDPIRVSYEIGPKKTWTKYQIEYIYTLFFHSEIKQGVACYNMLSNHCLCMTHAFF